MIAILLIPLVFFLLWMELGILPVLLLAALFVGFPMLDFHKQPEKVPAWMRKYTVINQLFPLPPARPKEQTL